MANIKKQYVQDKWNWWQSNDEYITIADSSGNNVQFYDALWVDIRTSSKEIRVMPKLIKTSTNQYNTTFLSWTNTIRAFYENNWVEYAIWVDWISYLVSDPSIRIAAPGGGSLTFRWIVRNFALPDWYTWTLAIFSSNNIFFLKDWTTTWSANKITSWGFWNSAEMTTCIKWWYVFICSWYHTVYAWDSVTWVLTTVLELWRWYNIVQMFLLWDQMVIFSNHWLDTIVSFWNPSWVSLSISTNSNWLERSITFPNQQIQNAVSLWSVIYLWTDHWLFQSDWYTWKNIQKANSTTFPVDTWNNLAFVNNYAINDRVVYFPQTNYIYWYWEYYTWQPLTFVKEFDCTWKTPESIWFNNWRLLMANWWYIYSWDWYPNTTAYLETEWITWSYLSQDKNSIKIRFWYNVNYVASTFDTITVKYKKDYDTSYTTIWYVTWDITNTEHVWDKDKWKQMLLTTIKHNRIKFRFEFTSTIGSSQTNKACIRDFIYLYEEIDNDL